MIPTELYDAYTTALTENDRQARAALAAIVAQLDPADVDGIRDAMLEAYPTLVRLYGTRAAQVAMEFYSEARGISGVQSAFAPTLPLSDMSGEVDEAEGDVRRLVGGLFDGKSTIGAFSAAMQQMASTRTMRMADSTIYALANADPAHPLVALVPHAGACGWCIMLGSRGFTNTKTAMEHMRHDGCKCEVVADFDTDNPALEGYDPDAMYQLYRESSTDADMKQWQDEWNAMSSEERAKYVRRTRDRTGAIKEIPGDWSTYVRNRTVQNMGKYMRDPDFKGGHEELAAWLPGQQLALALRNSGVLGVGGGGRPTSVPCKLPDKFSFDSNDPIAVQKKLQWCKDAIRNEPIENALIMTADGELWHSVGNKSSVMIKGAPLEGSKVIHNHTASEGGGSFGKDDFEEMRNSEYHFELYAVDAKYDYAILNARIPQSVTYNEVYRNGLAYYPDEDAKHSAMRYLHESGYIEYSRQRI